MKIVTYIILLTTLFFSCSQNIEKEEDNSKKHTNVLSIDNHKWKDIPRPILIDSALFWSVEDNYQKKNYHINAFSIVDTANILFYKHWSDSILDVLKGGGESLVFFFRDKEGTPEIQIATWAGDERYKKHCFLFIKYSSNNYEYFWNPFDKW